MTHLPIGIRICTYASAILLCVGAARAQDADKPVKVVTVEGITEYRYPNGLRFLSYPDAASSTITVNMTVLVGSRHEGYGETGMAHLLEHMLFKGAKLYPTWDKLDKAMTARGIGKDYNATTWTDRTNYYETMPAKDENLDFALQMEADRLLTAYIRREDLAKEMTVVRNEFERGEDNPTSILNQRMMAAAFEWHNYGKSTIGNRADIERVPMERLHAFYKKYYQVDNIVLIVAGNFDEAKALGYVTKYFGALKAPKRVLEQTYTEEPAQDGERTVTLRRIGKVPVVGLMYHIPAAAHPDNPACTILSMILGESPSGRLYKELVEKKKATSINYDANTYFDPGVLELTANVHEGVTPQTVRDLMIADTEDFAKKPATDEEVERMVRKYLSIREQTLAKSASTAKDLSEWIASGDWRLLFIYRDRIAKVKAADVNRVAKEYLRKSNRTVGMFIPTDKVERTSVPSTPDIEALVKDYKGGKAVTKGEAFDASYENLEKRIKRFKLASGIKVAFLPKKSRGETISAELTLHFGSAESLAGKNTPVSFIGSMLTRGTKNLTRAQIDDKLDSLKSSLGISSGLGTLTASWEGNRKSHGDLLKLLREILREPAFPEAELEILKQQTKQRLEKSMVDPSGLAFRTMLRQLSPHPKDNIHYVPTFEESLDRLAKVKRDDVAKIYQEQVGGTIGELVLVGDFDPDATLKQLETIFADWKSSVPYQRIPSVLVKGVKGKTIDIVTPDKENAVYVAALMFPMDDTSADYPAMEMGNTILGGGFTSRLLERFRQKEGWSYGASSRLTVESEDKVSQFLIFATCKPDVMKKVDAAALEELDKILKAGVTEDELKLAQKSYIEEMKSERGKDGVLTGMLRSDLYLGRTFAYQVDLEKKIAALTVKDVNRALVTNIIPSRLVIIRAGDFKKTSK